MREAAERRAKQSHISGGSFDVNNEIARFRLGRRPFHYPLNADPVSSLKYGKHTYINSYDREKNADFHVSIERRIL